MTKKKKILITKVLSQELRDRLSDFDIVEEALIAISYNKHTGLPEKTPNAIFTSKNSVFSLKEALLNKRISFDRVFCVGEQTERLLSQYGIDHTVRANSADRPLRPVPHRSRRHTMVVSRARPGEGPVDCALFGIYRRRLPRILLPVGAFEKTRIRALASRLDLPVAEKRDSQDVCFVAPGQHAQLVRQRRGDINTAGNLVTVDGDIVGRHDGIERFTVGQRKKLGVAMGEPYFVVRRSGDVRRHDRPP